MYFLTGKVGEGWSVYVDWSLYRGGEHPKVVVVFRHRNGRIHLPNSSPFLEKNRLSDVLSYFGFGVDKRKHILPGSD